MRCADDRAVFPLVVPPRVVIADDHLPYRQGLARLLRRSGIDVVADVPNADAAVRCAAAMSPDLVILDLNMPGLPGVEALRLLSTHARRVRALILSVSAQRRDVVDAMLSGAAGYVLKDDRPEDIVDAVRCASDGTCLVSPRVAAMLLAHGRAEGCLARHEAGVLELLADGRPEQEILETLATSPRSVREHLVSVLLKLALDEPLQRRRLRLVPAPSRAR
jgi:DNA-binding NarL/FixJ family response regulator